MAATLAAPQPSYGERSIAFAPVSAGAATQKWMCESCGFIYDPAVGDEEAGVAPGTPFDDIPDAWFCPVCGARQRDFAPLEE